MRMVEIINLLNERIKNNSKEGYRVGIAFLQEGIDGYEKQRYLFDKYDLNEIIRYEILINKDTKKQYIKLMNPKFDRECGFIIEDKEYQANEVITKNLDLCNDNWITFEIHCSEENIPFEKYNSECSTFSYLKFVMKYIDN